MFFAVNIFPSKEELKALDMQVEDLNGVAAEDEEDAAAAAELSSATEEKMKRTIIRRRNWQNGMPKTDAIRHAVPAPSSSPPEIQDVNVPVFVSLERCLQIHPHLEPLKQICHKGSKASTESSSSSSSSCCTELTSVWTTEYLRKKEEVLTKPKFYIHGNVGNQLNQEELTQLLRRREYSIPVLNAYMMQELLQDSGTFPHPKLKPGEKRQFPPCIRGENCVGCLDFYSWQDPRAKKGVVFTQMMFVSEYDALIKYSRLPPPRECVVCMIQALTEFILTDRALRMNADHYAATAPSPLSESSSSSSSSCSEDSTPTFTQRCATIYGREATMHRILQLFQNPIDSENGFYRDACLCDPDADDVFIDPLLRLNRCAVKFVVGAHTRAKLDISALLWKPKPPPTIEVGESLANFQCGAEL